MKSRSILDKVCIFTFLMVTFVSCTDNLKNTEISNQLDDDQEIDYKYKIEVNSSGDYTNYNSAMTIYSYGDSVEINSNEKQEYLFQYPLDVQSENIFRLGKTDSIAIRK